MEVLSLLAKMCRVIKGDSESTRSSRVQDYETVRHILACKCALCKAVKASYSSIVLALENIYETTHEPEALGLLKPFSNSSNVPT